MAGHQRRPFVGEPVARPGQGGALDQDRRVRHSIEEAESREAN
jgi:hypothetical protein